MGSAEATVGEAGARVGAGDILGFGGLVGGHVGGGKGVF